MAVPTKTIPNAPVKPQPMLLVSLVDLTKPIVLDSKNGCEYLKPITQRRGKTHSTKGRRVAFKVDQNRTFGRALLAVDHSFWNRFTSTTELISSSTGNKSSSLIIRRKPIIMRLFSHQKNARLYIPLVDSGFEVWYRERRIFRFSVASAIALMSLTAMVHVKTAAIGVGAFSIHKLLV